MSFEPSAEVRRIRDAIDHPIIDSDGHLIEFLPEVHDIMATVGGPGLVDKFKVVEYGARKSIDLSLEQRRAAGLMRSAWWGLPARNTLDRATALLPKLLYERMDEIGIDVAVLYPTYGLTCMGLEDEELRLGAARAFNLYYHQVFEPYGDRLMPVAIIPMFTPTEAIAELDFAVGELGMRPVMMTGLVPRPVDPENTSHRHARRMDTLGMDSPYDYDPVWRRCTELGVSPTFHSAGMGWGSRTSETNYVYNHLGNFAAAGEALCRAVFMGGVAYRYPELRWAFLEGGVAWGVNLLSDVIGHWEKRNRDAIGHYDPDAVDMDELGRLFDDYGTAAVNSHRDRLQEALHMLSEPDEDPATIDEFALSGVDSVEDILAIWDRFHFGCEADDPMTAIGFNRTVTPKGQVVKGIFASDVGHWDVPDVREVLPEAYELVDDGILDEADFRAFTFEHPMSLWAGTNSDFFKGTVIEEAL